MKYHSKMFNTLIRSITIATAVSAAACGPMKTNPTSEYPDLAGSVIPSNNKTLPQEYVDSGVFRLDLDRTDFVQGVQGSVFIKPTLNLPGVEYTLTLGESGRPENMTLTPATDAGHAGQYELKWAPQSGMLAAQELDRRFTVQIVINVVKTADAKATAVMNLIGHPRDITVKVVRTNSQPLIEKVNISTKEIQEGGSVAFDVIVRDIGADNDHLPRLLKANQNNGSREVTVINAADFVQIDPIPQSDGQGHFKFTGKIDTKDVTLPGTDAVVPARFLLVVNSYSPLRAPDELVEIRLARKTKVAAPVVAPPAVRPVTGTGVVPAAAGPIGEDGRPTVAQVAAPLAPLPMLPAALTAPLPQPVTPLPAPVVAAPAARPPLTPAQIAAAAGGRDAARPPQTNGTMSGTSTAAPTAAPAFSPKRKLTDAEKAAVAAHAAEAKAAAPAAPAPRTTTTTPQTPAQKRAAAQKAEREAAAAKRKQELAAAAAIANGQGAKP